MGMLAMEGEGRLIAGGIGIVAAQQRGGSEACEPGGQAAGGAGSGDHEAVGGSPGAGRATAERASTALGSVKKPVYALQQVYCLLYLDAIFVRIREDGAVSNKAVYLAIGVDCTGRKQVLGMWVQQTEGAKFWLKVMKELRQRGVTDILIAVTDALKGFPQAITAVFPQALVQTCIVHLLRNSLAQVSYRERKPLAQALKGVYRADSAQAARQALEAFRDGRLGRRYPAIARSWEAHWEQVVPFFSFTAAVRKVTHTTNAIESLNSCVRRAVAARGHFLLFSRFFGRAVSRFFGGQAAVFFRLCES